MPLFKAVSRERSKMVLIPAETIDELVEKCKRKLQLADGLYKIFLNDDGIEIDEDEVLKAYAQKDPGSVTLMIVPEGEEWQSPNAQNAVTNTAREQEKMVNTAPTADDPPLQSVGLNLWERFPHRLIQACEKGIEPEKSDRRSMIAIIADYMIHELKDTGRKTSERIAKILVDKYPTSFSDTIGGETVGAGMETLRTQIYNAVNYRKDTPHKQPANDSSGSDVGEGDNAAQTSRTPFRKTDEYGCVDYQSLLPASESKKSQSDKKAALQELFETDEEDEQKILDLMNDTYPTQRIVINSPKADICNVLAEWPYLTRSRFLIAHGSRLLGKPIAEFWAKSLEELVPACVKYLKYHYNVKNRTKTSATVETIAQKGTKLFAEAKEASAVEQNVIAKISVIIPILINHFDENAADLYGVIDMDLDVDTVKKDVPAYPILIVQDKETNYLLGRSLYDERAIHFVLIERSVFVKTTGLFDGILTIVVAYFVFRYEYGPKICKTLEFLQR